MRSSAITYPINRIPNANPGVCKVGIALCFRFRMIPSRTALRMNGVELGEGLGIVTPAKVIKDEALHARSLGGIDHGDLCADPAGTHHADGCILSR